MKKRLLLLLYLVFPAFLHAQNATADSQQLFQTQSVVPIDSLEVLLSREKDDASKAGLLGHLCYNYAFVKPEKGLLYGQQGLELSQKTEYKKGVLIAINHCLFACGQWVIITRPCGLR